MVLSLDHPVEEILVVKRLLIKNTEKKIKKNYPKNIKFGMKITKINGMNILKSIEKIMLIKYVK